MRFEIRRLHDEFHNTSIYVTHDQVEAMTMADRIVVMNAGRIEQIGTPEDVYDRPNSAFVARFIGASNVLDVTHVVGTRRWRSAAIALDMGQGDFAGPGAPMSFCVKMHDIELLAGDGHRRANTVPGVVRGHAYLGSHRDYVVDVGQEVLIAAPPALAVAAGLESQRAVRAGAVPRACPDDKDEHRMRMRRRWNLRHRSIAASCCSPARSHRPPLAQETTPAMIAAAEKEGKVVWYTSVDVKVAETIAKAFRAEYPKIQIEVERSGSERVFQRINQEYQSDIKNVDVVNSSDASHFLFWKQQKWLAPHTPPDVQRFAAQYKDPEGYYAVWRATLSVMAYNTNLVPAKEAPTGYLDLLDPKWKGKLVKAHPSYSGTSLTGTYALTKALGWDYLEKLSKQGVQQLQSTTAPPKSIASGERAVMVDGNEYNMFIEIDAKSPVEIIYAKEGTPFVTSPTAIFADAPHPNAARVFQNFLYTAEDAAGARRRGRRALGASGREGAARAARR